MQLFNFFRVYHHPVAAELHKKEENVTFFDVMFRSKNTVIQGTKKQFIRKIFGRFSAVLAPLLPSFIFGKACPSPIVSGSMGIENVLESNSTVWDKLLQLTMKKENDPTTVGEIRNILEMHRVSVDPGYLPPLSGTKEAKNDEVLAYYIASLLRKSGQQFERYKRGAPQEAAGYFKLSTFIYLMGTKAEGTGESYLDQKFHINLAYVELARLDDSRLSKVGEAAHAIAGGENPESVFHQYGIDMKQLAGNNEHHSPYEETGGQITSTPLLNRNKPEDFSALPQTQLSHAQEAGIGQKRPAMYQN